MGTPTAAVPSLERLHELTELVAVVTQPDRPRGRSHTPLPSAVKAAATRLELPIFQPANRQELSELPGQVGPVDVGVVAAYGMILRSEILEWPRTGFLNVHFSLLPRWRGAAPVERAIMAGDDVLGVTIMAMDEGLDTGPIVASATLDASRMNGGQATEALSTLGADLLVEELDGWLERRRATPQVDRLATYAPKIDNRDRILDPSMTVAGVVNRVRALTPGRAPQVMIDDEPHQLHAVWRLIGGPSPPPGTWFARDQTPHWVVADGVIIIKLIQPPGKRPMSGADWLRGRSFPD